MSTSMEEEYAENGHHAAAKAENGHTNGHDTTVRRNPKRITRSNKSHAHDVANLPDVIPLLDQQTLKIYSDSIKKNGHLIVQIPNKLLSQKGFRQNSILEIGNHKAVVEVQLQPGHDAITLSLTYEVQKPEAFNVTVKVVWVANEIQSKSIKPTTKLLSREPIILVKHKHRHSISDLFVEINLEYKQEETNQYRGLVNKGSTCYMNSFLQMLHHITSLRNIVFSLEIKEANKFPGTLQNLFYNLLTGDKAVTTDELVKSYGWTREQNFVQQDVQQFSCLLFEALEKKINEQPSVKTNLNSLFSGELTHYIQCLNVDYGRQTRQRFTDLQLQVAGFTNLQQSLSSYQNYEILEGDNRYRTDDHGLQDAKKGIKIESFGPILMIQLKRFEYNFHTDRNEKILSRFEYPQILELSDILGKLTSKYALYGVLVHSGESATSGHYYAYLKIKDWYKFNDSQVSHASHDDVFEYSFGGGNYNKYSFSQRQMTVTESQQPITSTAYMLVYYNMDMEKMIFPEETVLPKIQEVPPMEQQSHDIDVKVVRASRVKNIPVGNDGLLNNKALPEEDVSVDGRKEATELFKITGKEYPAYILYESNGMLNAIMIDKKHKSVLEITKKFGNVVLVVDEADMEEYENSLLLLDRLFEVNENGEEKYVYGGFTLVSSRQMSQNVRQLFNSHYSQFGYSISLHVMKTAKTVLPLQTGKFLEPPNSKSCLVQLVVESTHNEQKDRSFLNYLERQKTAIAVLIRSEDGKVNTRITIRNMTIMQLRQHIFENILNRNPDYVSAKNIVIKNKPSKNAKRYMEVWQGDLRELTKIESSILFGFSKIDSEQRQSNQILIEVRYRFKTLELGELIDIFFDKKDKKGLYGQIANNKAVQHYMEMEAMPTCRIMLMDQGLTQILRLYQKEDEDIYSSWKKEKGFIIIEGYQEFEDSLHIIIHHKSKSLEHIGSPEVIVVNRQTCKMAFLMLKAVQSAQKQQFIYDGKQYEFNRLKTSMTLYKLEESAFSGTEINKIEDIFVKELYGEEKCLMLDITHNNIFRQQKAMKINV